MKPKTSKMILAAALMSAVLLLLAGGGLASDLRAIKRIQDLSHASGRVGRYTALVIGIDDYRDPTISDLKTAVTDAGAVADLLESRYGFSDVTVLHNRQATLAALDQAFRTLVRRLGPSDSLLVYFAGHGEIDPLTGGGWWVPADARAGHLTSYFDNTRVQQYLKAMPARHVLVVADSCYSGTLFGESRDLPELIDDQFYLDLYNQKSRWGMTSGNKTPVADKGIGGHSIFAHQLLKSLQENRKPYLTPREVYAAIGPVIRNNSEQRPVCRPIKMTGDQGGEFVFILAGGQEPPDPPRAQPSSGSLQVTSRPPGARIVMGQETLGTTPLTVARLPVGKIRVTAVLAGHHSQEKPIWVRTGRRVAVEFVLTPLTTRGGLKITSDPPGAQWHLDGALAGRTPDQMDDLAEGRHMVKVEESGFEAWSGPAVIQAGETTAVHARLTAIRQTAATSNIDIVTNSLGMTFVPIPPGTFTRGSPSDEEGRNTNEARHEVTLTKGFHLQTTEVTQAQWKAVMGSNPSTFKGDDLPVENMSWNDVQDFVQKLNAREGSDVYRLPTEAEWEYACRAGTTTARYWGEQGDCRKANYGAGFSSACKATKPGKPQSVGSYPPNPWGLYDMLGNVWEWCQDWFGKYPSGPVTDPFGPNGSSIRVVRGGSWGSDAADVRCAFRSRGGPIFRLYSVGFRLLRE